MIDYAAIIKALDARTLEGFKAWSETFAKGMSDALIERDKLIATQDQQINSLAEKIKSLEKDLCDLAANLPTQKQVREEVEAAVARAPVPTYKGVYDKDAEYQSGDMVTQDGSVWHCNAAVAGEKPGGNEFWTLAVKRGRDGKDATKDAE